MNKFSMRIVAAVVAASMITTPAFAGRFGGGGGGFRSSGSSFSSGSRSFSSGSSYRSTSSYARPASQPATNRFSNSNSGYNTSKPAQTRVVSRPAYTSSYYRSAPVVQNHYYGGGYGGGFGHSFTSSPFFWMWLMDRPHNQPAPVYVNGGGQQMAPAQGGYAPQMQAAPQDNGPGFFSMIFYGLLNLVILILVIAALVWVVIKIRNLIKGN